jgi:Flp pilus assembly protein TadD
MALSRWVAPVLALGVAVLLAGCGQDLHSGEFTTGSLAPSDQRPSDEPLRLGKEQFERGDYGLAERSFRSAVEANSKSVDAWIGLAASYDRLSRFDLADQAYEQAVSLAGYTPEMLNNLGYHHLLKGELKQARVDLLQAAALEPDNPYVQGNLKLLESWKKGPNRQRSETRDASCSN